MPREAIQLGMLVAHGICSSQGWLGHWDRSPQWSSPWHSSSSSHQVCIFPHNKHCHVLAQSSRASLGSPLMAHRDTQTLREVLSGQPPSRTITGGTLLSIQKGSMIDGPQASFQKQRCSPEEIQVLAHHSCPPRDFGNGHGRLWAKIMDDKTRKENII